MISIISSFSRLSLLPLPCRTSKLLFHTSPCLAGEPLKKKKRLDPAIIKAREDRKKRKIEKQIRRLEKNARQLKPIEECEIPLVLLDNQKERVRQPFKYSKGVLETRELLEKQWAKYKHEEHLADIQLVDRIMYAQQKAVDELRKESEELYLEAVQIEPMLLPLKIEGPSDTPSIHNYYAPDGDYQDVSRKWN
ncbi:hypothetical protein PPYR_01542 [Photinus pyralis]|uniref:Large ribosomal subunit protein mL40 n=1 Tax=Photinus pyralis TaxID=7054 RepID=A0A1Y1NL65_PHOPY|nr:39S ribosomal protein L40, mitochondrial [Photinus pyralis]KAB0804572.1 hypothetical protein PPYR_01542 [Photinus pyralis]